MSTVISKDGTRIAYDRVGQGAPVILVDGAWGYRGFFGQDDVAKLLATPSTGVQSRQRDDEATGASSGVAPRFTAISYDRRGRGDSGDTLPYAIGREVEDIGALVDAVGGSAYIYGASSGAALALVAAAELPGITKVALYEPPLVLDESRPPMPADYLDNLRQMLAEGRRGDMVKYFARVAAGAPAIATVIVQFMPFYAKMKAIAHTVIYDTIIVEDLTQPSRLSATAAAIKGKTLVISGGKSPAWMRHAAETIAGAIPGAAFRTLDGQTHEVSAKAIAPVLDEFFKQ